MVIFNNLTANYQSIYFVHKVLLSAGPSYTIPYTLAEEKGACRKLLYAHDNRNGGDPARSLATCENVRIRKETEK